MRRGGIARYERMNTRNGHHQGHKRPYRFENRVARCKTVEDIVMHERCHGTG